MSDPDEVRRFATAIMTMIKEDHDSGQVPRGAVSLDELDDCVDIEDYFRQIGLPSGDHDATDLRDAQQAILADIYDYRDILSVPGDDLRALARYRTDHLAEALLGVLDLPVIRSR